VEGERGEELKKKNKLIGYLCEKEGDNLAAAVLQFNFELNGFGLMAITFLPFRPLPIHGHLDVR